MTPEFREVDREELTARRRTILDSYGLDHSTPYLADCGCCPDLWTGMSWDDFEAIRDIDFLLGGS